MSANKKPETSRFIKKFQALLKLELVGARPLHLAGARPLGRLKAPLGLLLLRKRGLVGARPLHLAGARPLGRLKAPLGLSLLRKRGLVGARPLHLAGARPLSRLKAPLGLSLLRCASQTQTFENTPLSAACKKTQGKLWRKDRGLDGASPLDRIYRM